MGIKEERKVYIDCDCCGEILVLKHCTDEDEIDIAIYQYGHYKDNRLDFRSRLKYMWHILTTGQCYGDQITLHKSKLNKLINFLKETV